MLAAKGSSKAFSTLPGFLSTSGKVARTPSNVNLKVDVIHASNSGSSSSDSTKHVIFLHGLFGKG